MHSNKSLQIALLVDTNHLGKLNINWAKQQNSSSKVIYAKPEECEVTFGSGLISTGRARSLLCKCKCPQHHRILLHLTFTRKNWNRIKLTLAHLNWNKSAHTAFSTSLSHFRIIFSQHKPNFFNLKKKKSIGLFHIEKPWQNIIRMKQIQHNYAQNLKPTEA